MRRKNVRKECSEDGDVKGEGVRRGWERGWLDEQVHFITR